MKTINYTGSSKLISRIVHLLNRKAPLPLDGDGNAVWGTNGQVLTSDGNGNTSWTTPQGGGGDVTDVEVNGTSVVNAQGVAEVSVPTKTSDLNNDSGFITNLVNDLANYYTKSQTYTQAEVNALISGIVTLNILVVQTLPTQDISTTTIYLVPKQDAGTDDIYDEYLYINNAWELIGTTQIDLSNYVTTTDLSTALADYVTSVGLATILADYVQSSDLATVATSGSYNDLSNKPTIPAAQIQSDWNQSDTTAKDYIKNKPTIPTVTKTVFYGTCTGQAANQTKAVVVDSSQGFALTAGIILLVKFDANNTYSATAAAPVKLNVNSTGAKNIYYAASNAPTGTNTTAFGRTNYVNQYYYDGTNWIWSGSSADNNTTYSNMSANELTTGTATTGRSISAKVLNDWNTAAHTTYSNTTSGLSATDAQGAIDAVEGQIAKHRDHYDPTKSYYPGDYTIYDDVLYLCTTACSPASWSVNQSCFTSTTLANAVSVLMCEKTISGTTTSSGALETPTAIRGKSFISIMYASDSPVTVGFIFRRDSSYLTCLNNSLQAVANTNVKVRIIYTYQEKFYEPL